MIAILCGSLTGVNFQANIISENLRKSGYENIVIDFHKISETSMSLMESPNGLQMYVCGTEISPKVIYIANNIRTDSIINIPNEVIYPNAYRASLNQLFLDIRFGFENVQWFPGNYEGVKRGDSKPFLFSVARRCGLSVPKFTADSSFKPNISGICKKPLGFPFKLSINRKNGKEVGVTGIIEFDENKMVNDGYLWQWQSLIRAQSQIRCLFVDGKIWSVIWGRGEKELCDFRDINQIKREEISWDQYSLPDEIVKKLSILMKSLGLRMSAPEFLIDQNGEHIFIDLNPCGDWYGFFPKNINEEIIQAITKTLKSAL